MPTIQIDIGTAAEVTRIVDAFCGFYNYSATLPGGGANPETRNQFAKRQLALFVKQTIKNFEGDPAARTGRAAVEAQIEGMNIT